MQFTNELDETSLILRATKEWRGEHEGIYLALCLRRVASNLVHLPRTLLRIILVSLAKSRSASTVKFPSGTLSVEVSPGFGTKDIVDEISSGLETSKREQGRLKKDCLRRDSNAMQCNHARVWRTYTGNSGTFILRLKPLFVIPRHCLELKKDSVARVSPIYMNTKTYDRISAIVEDTIRPGATAVLT